MIRKRSKHSLEDTRSVSVLSPRESGGGTKRNLVVGRVDYMRRNRNDLLKYSTAPQSPARHELRHVRRQMSSKHSKTRRVVSTHVSLRTGTDGGRKTTHTAGIVPCTVTKGRQQMQKREGTELYVHAGEVMTRPLINALFAGYLLALRTYPGTRELEHVVLRRLSPTQILNHYQSQSTSNMELG